MNTVVMTRAQLAALYALGRKLPGELLLIQHDDRRVLVEHPDSERSWLISVEGATTKL